MSSRKGYHAKAEAAGRGLFPTDPESNTVTTGSIPISPTAKAAGSGFPPSNSRGAAGANSSNIFGNFVGYVHNVSLVKPNKRDSHLNYRQERN